ncbi:MAG: extracellular solute-binding protein [Planctomycetota bacterium]|nr:extracellular solute-binding protein [Planctomycetota bacterium]
MKHLIVLAAIALLGLIGCGGGSSPSAATDTLVIYSPHGDEVREEFTQAFVAWYKAKTGRDVDVSWPDPGGGGTQVLKRLEDKFRAGRFDIDLVFGGGPIFDQMKQLAMLQKADLPQGAVAAIPPKAADQPLVDPDGYWYGTAISTFGLVCNRTLIRDKGLPEVKDWLALADPKYFGYVGAADPAKSATALKVYEVILQAYGYERGMGILMRLGGNAREFYTQAGDVPRNCAQGFIAVGPCIDFYALRQMRSEGGKNLAFLAPPGLTVVTCDPIALLKNAPHPEAARQFMEFVLRPEGQRLWILTAGAPGGPRKFTLDRLPILPDLYPEAAATSSAGQVNPFKVPPADFYDAAKENLRQPILADYLRVTLVENHAQLKKAWQAVIAAGLPADRLALLTRPLVSEEEMLRLARGDWAPVRAAEDATAEKKAELLRQEEQRQRRKSDTLTRWSDEIRQRYEALAK